MKVYVVANLKGGVGKTTTTVNVAYTFSEMGGRVLVIDLDPQCNCTRFFAKVNGYSKTVREVLEKSESNKQHSLSYKIPGYRYCERFC